MKINIDTAISKELKDGIDCSCGQGREDEMGNFLGVSTLVLKGIDEAVEVPEAIAKPRRVIAS